MMDSVLYIVVPCYNEEEVLPETAKRLTAKLGSLRAAGVVSPESRIVFVDDGSKDRTWELISGLHAEDPVICGVKLTRNRGHQYALLAGLMTVRTMADAVISMDADLQDDINAVDAMLVKFGEGCDIVYGVRARREKDSLFKRATAEGFYKLMALFGAEVIFNHADYRLMSRRALDHLAEFGEYNLFLRGIVPMIGLRTDTVAYDRGERFAGESKYPLKKMLAFAWEGITSLSASPLRAISVLGSAVFTGCFLAVIVLLLCRISGSSVSGLAIAATALGALGGLQLLATGIVGQYVGKAYLETKHRPRFLVGETLFGGDGEAN